MSEVPRKPTPLEYVRSWFGGWGFFPLPDGETVDCWKDRRHITGRAHQDWAHMAHQSTQPKRVDRVGADGVGSGTPMQIGSDRSRELFWGGGYGRHESNRTLIPEPVAGIHWTTGLPNPIEHVDRHCIVAAPDGTVHELIQFDVEAPRRPAGFAQQALGWGQWRNGQLIAGRATTAPDVPQHAYIWGPGSARRTHVQGLVIDDYLGADGSAEFAARHPNGPVAGGWYALDPDSESYRRNIALKGESAARACAAIVHGFVITDRKMGDGDPELMNPEPYHPHVLTQAGAWARETNQHLFSIDLADLRRVA